MSIEGLQYLLDKKEVVPTASAVDLRERPESIEAGYLRHVRTYIPMSRLADGASFGVDEFERRLLKRVREARAPRGYITAGYGYGKTSTALYLWQRAQDAGLLAVPPFQLEKLPYLIEALYGWGAYQLRKRRPTLVPELDTLYHATVDRSLQQIAQQYNLTTDNAQDMLQRGLLSLDVLPTDYLKFFDGVTEIALRAGYNGVVLIADELQQFIRPRIRESGDQISPLFNILQLMGTREADASLAFGLIISMTLEEVSLIRDTFKRADLLARMKELSLDLTDLYDNRFATTLWQRMAEAFDFQPEAAQIVDEATLQALGNISGNKNISDGPRTVVNVFGRMVRVYLERLKSGDARPYSPIDLMNDFLDEQVIYFAGNEKLRSAARAALNHAFVQSQARRYVPAIKLIGAFGVEGVPRSIQQRFELEGPIDELMQKTIGEVVRVGSNLSERTVALLGLDSTGDPDWLKETIRNFRIGWSPAPDNRETRERTLTAFTTLLTERIFSKAKVLDQREGNMVANRALVLEVDAEHEDDNGRRRYPRRRLHIRVYWDDEPLKDSTILGDVCIEYRLNLHSALPPDEVRRFAEAAYQSTEPNVITIPVNLQYMPDDAYMRPLHQLLKDVWSPYDLSSLVLLNIHALLSERIEDGDVPKHELSSVQSGFMSEILDYATKDLFNSQVGANVGMAGPELSQYALRVLLGQRYPKYVTLMSSTSWASSLGKYKTALERLSNVLQRQGKLPVEITKGELSEKFNLSNTGLDNFMAANKPLLREDRPLSDKKPGQVTFTLHPLEQAVMGWLSESEKTTQQGKYTTKRIEKSVIMRRASTLGYLDDEIEKSIELLVTRELIAVAGDWIIEKVSEAVNVDQLRTACDQLRADVTALAQAFAGGQQVKGFEDEVFRIRQALDEQLRAKQPDPAILTKIDNSARKLRQSVGGFAEDRRRDLLARLAKLLVTPLREQEQQILHQPLSDEIDYVDQVNHLRVKLIEQLSSTLGLVDEHNAEIRRVQEALGGEGAQIEQLVKNELRARELEKAQSDLQSRVLNARERFQDYDRWRALVREGAAANRALEEMGLEGVDRLRHAFKDFVRSVRAEISSRKLDALTQHVQFTESLSDLQTQIRELRQNAGAAFEAERAQFRNAFEHMSVEPERALSSLAFNPSEPRNAYELLYSLARAGLKRGVDELQRYISERQQTAQVLQTQAAHLASRERQQLEQAAGQIRDNLNGLTERVQTLSHQLANTADDAALRGVIADFAGAYRAVKEDAQGLYRSLEQLRGSVSRLQPTPEEQRLRSVIQTQMQPGGGEVNVFGLQSQYAADPEGFWRALRGLLEKDFVLVHVSLARDAADGPQR